MDGCHQSAQLTVRDIVWLAIYDRVSLLALQSNHLLDKAPKTKMCATWIQCEIVKTTSSIVEAWEAWGKVANGDKFYVLDKDVVFFKVTFSDLSVGEIRRDLSLRGKSM